MRGESSSASASSSSLTGISRRPLGNNNGSSTSGGNNNNSSSSSSMGDRFIPNRSKMNTDLAEMNGDSEGDEYKTALSEALMGGNGGSAASGTSTGPDRTRVLAFGEKAPAPKADVINNLNVLYSTSLSAGDRKKGGNSKLVTRQIASAPSRILDAPGMMDDYYLNLLSWSDTNTLAVALSQTVYLWNATTGDIVDLCSVPEGGDNYISSVSWVQQGGSHIAIGTSSGKTQLWDVEAQKQLRSMDGHTDRVGALSWNEHILTSGGRDAVVVNHDVRIAQHKVATLTAHRQEVCQLAWSPDGKSLASGGNDNKICIWDASTSSSSTARFELMDHQAAVKAMAWSPHERNLLATGGGTADRTIKFWNTQTGSMLNSIDTESQVCSLMWNPFEKEILSSHGYARNHLCLWKYPSMAKVKELEGHTSRVLHLARSPDGGSVVSAAGDETLRFWDVFAPTSKGKGKRSAEGYGSELPLSAEFMRPMQIR